VGAAPATGRGAARGSCRARSLPCAAVQTWVRYAVSQIPGWLLIALLLFGLVHFLGLSPAAAGLGLALWMLKDALLYPLLRRSYELHPHVPAEHLLGASAIAQEDLAPEGYVRVGSELWRARLRDPGARVAVGAALRVREARNLVLVVEPESDGGAR